LFFFSQAQKKQQSLAAPPRPNPTRRAMPLPRAVSSTLRIVEMTTSVPYSSSSSLCHLQIPNEPHRRQCGPTADRLMVLVNLLLLVRARAPSQPARHAACCLPLAVYPPPDRC
jgi:hypothetical protein